MGKSGAKVGKLSWEATKLLRQRGFLPKTLSTQPKYNVIAAAILAMDPSVYNLAAHGGKKQVILAFAEKYGLVKAAPVYPKAVPKIARPKKFAYKTDDFLLSREWRELRYKVLLCYGRRCMCCGANPESNYCVHVDHIKPRSKYPHLALVFDNLQVLCDDCNIGKSNTDETDFRPKPQSKEETIQ